MAEFIKILSLDNIFEIMQLKELLEQEQIPYLYKDIQDTAYNGLFKIQMGLGIFYAPEIYASRIEILYNQIKKTNQT